MLKNQTAYKNCSRNVPLRTGRQPIFGSKSSPVFAVWQTSAMKYVAMRAYEVYSATVRGEEGIKSTTPGKKLLAAQLALHAEKRTEKYRRGEVHTKQRKDHTSSSSERPMLRAARITTVFTLQLGEPIRTHRYT